MNHEREQRRPGQAQENPDLVVKLEDRVHPVGRGVDQVVGDHDDLRAGGGEQSCGCQQTDEAINTPVEPQPSHRGGGAQRKEQTEDGTARERAAAASAAEIGMTKATNRVRQRLPSPRVVNVHAATSGGTLSAAITRSAPAVWARAPCSIESAAIPSAASPSAIPRAASECRVHVRGRVAARERPDPVKRRCSVRPSGLRIE